MAKTAYGPKVSDSFYGESQTSYETEPPNGEERSAYHPRGAAKDGYTQFGRRPEGAQPGDIVDNDEADRREEMIARYGGMPFYGSY